MILIVSWQGNRLDMNSEMKGKDEVTLTHRKKLISRSAKDLQNDVKGQGHVAKHKRITDKR